MPEKDIAGVVFGRWIVLERDKSKERGNMWRCECSCGKVSTVNGYDLRTGKTKSCGCLRAEQLSSHNMFGTRFYSIYRNMISRCRNKNSPNYGGRGITVCSEWKSFEKFKSDMHASYLEHVGEHGESNTSLDRIDVNGNYEITNVRWATMKEQVVNRRLNKNNSSGHAGINWVKSRNKWRVRIHSDHKEYHVGMFETLREAVSAKELAIKQIERERLND